jgi:hypothetical protein
MRGLYESIFCNSCFLFSSVRPTTTVPAIQFIIQHIRVMLYSGEFDLNCNTLGTIHTLEAGIWSNR